MRRKTVELAILCAVVFSVLGAGQSDAQSPGLQLSARELAPAGWEFYLGTWTYEDEFGATHIITFYKQGIYGVEVKWDKSDLLLGTVQVADASEVVFFDSDGGEDRYGIVVWSGPVTAYGIFHNSEQTDADGNDQIALTVYRYVGQGTVQSSRDNFTIVMQLTRQPQEP
jgi:hypothetical protein